MLLIFQFLFHLSTTLAINIINRFNIFSDHIIINKTIINNYFKKITFSLNFTGFQNICG
jgi:hypothetical protein